MFIVLERDIYLRLEDNNLLTNHTSLFLDFFQVDKRLDQPFHSRKNFILIRRESDIY